MILGIIAIAADGPAAASGRMVMIVGSLGFWIGGLVLNSFDEVIDLLMIISGNGIIQQAAKDRKLTRPRCTLRLR